MNDKLVLKLGWNAKALIDTTVLILGNNTEDREALFDRICEVYEDNDVNIIRLSKGIRLEDAVTTITNLKETMVRRFKLMEQEQVPRTTELSTPLQDKCIAIENFNMLVNNQDTELIKQLYYELGSIVRLGKSTQIRVIICCENKDCLNLDLITSTNTKFVVGELGPEDAIYALDLNMNIKLKAERALCVNYNLKKPTICKINKIT